MPFSFNLFKKNSGYCRARWYDAHNGNPAGTYRPSTPLPGLKKTAIREIGNWIGYKDSPGRRQGRFFKKSGVESRLGQVEISAVVSANSNKVNVTYYG
jgi:hypothetical protein